MTIQATTTMNLVRVRDINRVELDSIARPQPGAEDVLVEVAYCGICGSDLGYIAMGGLLGPGVPMPLGHELSGIVIETGANVKHLRPGDRVVVNPEGNGNRIGNSGPEGAFAPYLLVRGAALDPSAVLKIPDRMSMEEGAMVEPLSVAMHAVNQSRVASTDKVVIFGAGPIGLCIALVLRYRGVENIVVADLSPHRLAVAEQLGATTVQGTATGMADFLREQHGEITLPGMPALPGSDVYFEATGAAAVFNQITQLAKRGARVVVVGVHKTPVELDLVNLLLRELTITGSMAYPSEFPEVIAMLDSGQVDVSPLITHRYPLSKFHEALDSARDTGQAIKVMVDCQR